ncbi:hypothetical protein CRUP_014622 [Coryphaenoides rupestris]|nr:hypothetical protein CRUP_014622 [Coryphaenoides rupestris]
MGLSRVGGKEGAAVSGRDASLLRTCGASRCGGTSSCRSLSTRAADPGGALEDAALQHVGRVLLKQCHAAATTFILEGVKQNADKSTISIGSQLPHINDVSWRLEYHMKNGHVHKVNEPFYLLSLDLENGGPEGSAKNINFSCTVEQLQDVVGKLKDAAKSLEKATHV